MNRIEIIFTFPYFYDNSFFDQGDRFILPKDEADELVRSGIAKLA